MELPVKERIRKWCEETGLFKEEVEDEKSFFHFKVIAPARAATNTELLTINTIDISQSKIDGDKIITQAGIAFDKSFITPMKSLSERQDIVYDLYMTLDSRPESYFIDYSDGIIKSIVVFEEIYMDGLSKDRLITAVKGVNKSLVLALWILRPVLEELANKSDSDQTSTTVDDKAGPNIKRPVDNIESKPRAGPASGGEKFAAFCSKCGKPNEKKARFCTGCGSSMVMG
jgi:hypothetical protein